MAGDIFLKHSLISQGAAISLTGGQLHIVKNEFFGAGGHEETIIQLSDGMHTLSNMKIVVDKGQQTAKIMEIQNNTDPQVNDRGIEEEATDVVIENEVDISVHDQDPAVQDRGIEEEATDVVIENEVDISVHDQDPAVQDRGMEEEESSDVVIENEVDISVHDQDPAVQDRGMEEEASDVVIENEVDISVHDQDPAVQDRGMEEESSDVVIENEVDISVHDQDPAVQDRGMEEEGILVEVNEAEVQHLDSTLPVFSLEPGKRLLLRYDESERVLIAKAEEGAV